MKTMVVLLVLGLCLAACGDDPSTHADDFPVPAWAKVAPEQIAEAKKHGVPVAFENDLGMRFVLIPAGTFTMGSPEDEEGRESDETQHEVTISKALYMQTAEVTNGSFWRWRPSHDSDAGGGTPMLLNGEHQPAVELSWWDATAFGSWLSKEDARRMYRLPTSAEWEYACRAGTSTPYWCGETISVEQANFLDDRQDHLDRRTSAAGTYDPNGWGLYDMHGNVYEWCEDAFPQGEAAVDREGEPSKEDRVVRGGCWLTEPFTLRSAFRHWGDPDSRCDLVGFRLVSPLPEPSEK